METEPNPTTDANHDIGQTSETEQATTVKKKIDTSVTVEKPKQEEVKKTRPD